jgi:double-strand break repair protein MRE11
MDDDIIRIIISTDNHLGFAYKDPIRCDDCFASFEEVFIAAKEVKKT